MSTMPLKYAGLGRRAVAKIIDLVIVFVAMSGWILILNSVFGDNESTTPLPITAFRLFSVFSFPIAYGAAFLDRYGATPGKLLLGIRVVTSVGGQIKPGLAFTRTLVEWLLLAVIIVLALLYQLAPKGEGYPDMGFVLGMVLFGGIPIWILGYFVAIFDAQRQAMHDKLCGTRVILREH